MPSAPVLIGWIICGLTFLAGSSCAVIAFRHIRLLRRGQTLPTTTGFIRHAELTEHADADGDTYRFQLEYVFVVDGETHVGRSISPGSDRIWGDRVRLLADRYPPKSRVTVYYDPARPARCYLEVHPWNVRNKLLTQFAVYFITLSLVIAAIILTAS